VDPALIHPSAIVEPGAAIGSNTRVWAFTHVLPGAVIGTGANICDHVFIEGGVRIGDRVTVKSGVQLWSGITLEDDVFVGPNATFTNDLFPRSKDKPREYAKTLVRKNASIGANATVLAGTVIGANAMVGAGAVVTRDVPPNAIVLGNPARITGYVATQPKGPLKAVSRAPSAASVAVDGVRVLAMPVVSDIRGKLSFGEHDTHLPFLPRRYFVVYDVPTKEVRGEHAHRRLHQVLVCLRGSVMVMVDDAMNRDEVLLEGPENGLYVPPMVWAAQYRYSADAILLTLASDTYDPDDYIRNYEEFLEARKAGGGDDAGP
jgi:acetyltransferase-like isoleucine patch superfamily enzyme/dTDP-4-dehydrorhamnose 3,5-epimerase-like enzyme